MQTEGTRKPRRNTGQGHSGDWPGPKEQLLPHIHSQRLKTLQAVTFLSTDPSYYSDGGGGGLDKPEQALGTTCQGVCLRTIPDRLISNYRNSQSRTLHNSFDISLNILISNNKISIRCEEGDKRAQKFVKTYKSSERKRNTSTVRCYSEHIKNSIHFIFKGLGSCLRR